QAQFGTDTVDHWSRPYVWVGAEPGWEETFCHSRRPAGRSDAARCQVSAVLTLSFRNIRHSTGVFDGWAVGCLCELPGRNAVARQSGWDRTASAYFAPYGRPPSPMVTRRQTDCFCCGSTRQTHPHLCRI